MKERGTAAIELAMAMIIMLMLAIGAYEWGTGFADRIAMTSAVREAGRVGSAAGRLPDADCRIIEAASAALNAVVGNPVKALWIYESDTDGTVGGSRQEYRPADEDEPALECDGGRWFLAAGGWPSSSRSNSGVNRDWLGVKVIVDHEWKTGFLWWNGSVEWEEDAVFRLEPAVVSG